MLKKLLWTSTLFIALFETPVFAQNIEIVGTIEVNKPSVSKSMTPAVKKSPNQSMPNLKIALLKLDLSAQAQHVLSNRVEAVQGAVQATPQIFNKLPRQIQLNMNGVPVLNQGSFGTCVTFAATAAIDAVLGKGDYISQLCQLELGRYLEKNTYTSSGWNGSWAHIILSQMDVFGIVPKTYQNANGCAGLTEYPLSGDEPAAELSLSDYHPISEAIPPSMVAWTPIVEVYQISADQLSGDQILTDVKKSLVAGDRVMFGVLLLDFDQGIVGAVGSYREKFDSWVLTPEIANDINEQTQFAGHEMVITGYNDDAIAKDTQGRGYRGLLTLRNSWSDSIGDQGNFYMSYDYFRALTLEAHRIRHLN